MDEAEVTWKPFLNAALGRIREQQLTELGEQFTAFQKHLGELDATLEALEQDVKALKGHKDPLPLALAVIALLLGLGALALTLRRWRKPE